MSFSILILHKLSELLLDTRPPSFQLGLFVPWHLNQKQVPIKPLTRGSSELLRMSVDSISISSLVSWRYWVFGGHHPPICWLFAQLVRHDVSHTFDH